MFSTTTAFSVITVGARAIGALSTFFIAALVTVEIYGQISILQNTSYGLGLLMALGMSSIPFKYCVQRTYVAWQVLHRSLNVILIGGLVLGVVVVILGLLFPDAARVWFQNESLIIGIVVTLVFTVVNNASLAISSFFRAQRFLLAFGVFDIVLLLISLLAAVLLLAVGGGAIAFIGGRSVGALLVIGAAFIYLMRYRSKLPRANDPLPSYGHLLKFGLPFIPMALTAWGQGYVDRLVVLVLLSPTDLGIYAFATQVFASCYTILGAINQSVIPNYTTATTKRQTNQLLAYTFGLSMALLALSLLAIWLWLQTDILLTYQPGAPIAAIKILAILPSALQMHYVTVIAYQRSQHQFLFVGPSLGIVASTAGSLVLLPAAGVYGVAIGSVLGYVVSLFVVLLYYSIIVRRPFDQGSGAGL